MSRTPKLKILLVDDHEMVRIGLRSILGRFADLEIVGEAVDGASALKLAEATEPDLVLLDLRLPDLPGQEVCRRIIALGQEARVLILTSFVDEESALASVEAGAGGLILKQIDPPALHQAILDAAQGRMVMPREVAEGMAHALQARSARERVESRLRSLSPQEMRIAEWVAAGLLNKEIADQMGLSEKTVKNYLGNIFIKLAVGRRAQLASLITEHKASSGQPPKTSPGL